MDQHPTYYKIMPKDMFKHQNVVFVPGREFNVSAEFYESTLEDGTKFSDHCAKVHAPR